MKLNIMKSKLIMYIAINFRNDNKDTEVLYSFLGIIWVPIRASVAQEQIRMKSRYTV